MEFKLGPVPNAFLRPPDIPVRIRAYASDAAGVCSTVH